MRAPSSAASARDLHELSGVAKLRDDPRRNPKACRDSLDTWRRGARLAEARHQPPDPRLHLGIEQHRLVLRQAHPMPTPEQPTGRDQLIRDGHQLGIIDALQRPAAAVAGR